ncbi:MAG TPA: hypothetical protein VHZ56_11510 [Devosia sp.]|jgi:hypothetical protein|nr:hypothetical protein [Devosia sp.]
MFVLRSAFWLTVGFFLVAPHGVDLGAQVAAMKDQAIAASVQAGQQFIATQIVAGASKAVAIAATPSTPSVDLPMQVSPTQPFVFPRQRPAAMG